MQVSEKLQKKVFQKPKENIIQVEENFGILTAESYFKLSCPLDMKDGVIMIFQISMKLPLTKFATILDHELLWKVNFVNRRLNFIYKNKIYKLPIGTKYEWEQAPEYWSTSKRLIF